MVFVIWHKGGSIASNTFRKACRERLCYSEFDVPFGWVLWGICRAGPCVRPHGLVWHSGRVPSYKTYYTIFFFSFTIFWSGNSLLHYYLDRCIKSIKIGNGDQGQPQPGAPHTWRNPCYFLWNFLAILCLQRFWAISRKWAFGRPCRTTESNS